ncbi:MAG TPA: hypothetical protein EYO52_03995 [Candidatus Marinimicrobia bacterium]|nr:hypothetical protein [Candidatus Neomarinimicrobiota bacterium]
MKRLSFPFLLISLVSGQWNYSGSFQPITMHRTSDLSNISLPFRIAELEVGFSKGDFDFITSSAVEFRWTGGDPKIDYREAYLIWYPSWGEVKVGKQIHAWGAVDGNNPTDNLNPYDYYYMFLAGADRKIGTLSGSVKYYWNDWQLEAVVIPEHEPNRYPFGEDDFPIAMDDPGDFLTAGETLAEYGMRVQTTMGNSDISLSYFSGRDRGFSLIGYNYYIDWAAPVLTYRKTNIIGIDIVTFFGDLTGRTEVGYFNTNNDHTTDIKTFNDAAYVQFASQLEYTTTNDITLMIQLIGNDVLEVNGSTYAYDENGNPTELIAMNEDELQQGMGTPFAMFTDLGMFLSATGNYWDDALEIRINTFMDLEDNQAMLGGGVSYSPVENLDLELSITQFYGAEGTQFKTMEDFSHIQIGLKYSF